MTPPESAHDIDVWQDPDAYSILFEPTPRRIRATLNGETVADSRRAMIMLESKHLPIYYFPRDDVRMDLLSSTDHRTHCPFKGDAEYWSVAVGDKVVENAAWSYPAGPEGTPDISGYIALYWGKMDHWHEEDEEIVVHPRDPHKRIDVIESHAHVRVVLGGETVAESRNARFLFETGLPTRYYMPGEDVRMDLLAPTTKQSRCPYKGEAHYWSARVGEALFENIVWSYPEPIAECPRVKDLLCFFNEHVDAIFVDGEEVPKVATPWS